jgi:hypothetical protein
MLRRDTSRRWCSVPVGVAPSSRPSVSTSTPSRSAASLNMNDSTP